MTDRRQRLAWRLFPLLERAGLHLTRVSFYEPIPDTRSLPPRTWEGAGDPPGVDLREDAQVALLGELARFAGECAAAGHPTVNGQFERVDAEVLWGMLRLHKPRRMIEVGGGHSTRVAAGALLRNAAEGSPCELETVEPHPDAGLRAGFPGLTRLTAAPVQDVPLDRFTSLAAGDVLFVDSSHVVRIGSDVQYLLLDVVPRLAPGVIVQVHDVFLPAEYPRHLVMDWRRFWNEQYVLQAFLAGNRDVEVLWGSSLMHLRHPERLGAAFPSYLRGGLWPSSFWFRRVG